MNIGSSVANVELKIPQQERPLCIGQQPLGAVVYETEVIISLVFEPQI
jgi:hypothetical protein